MIGILRAAGLGLVVLTGLCGAGHAQSSVGESRWDGAYYYPDNRQPVAFHLDLQQTGNQISGRTAEPATFGNGTSQQLFAYVSGSINGAGISFVKTYDGTGGVNHSVQYDGTIAQDGLSMSGTWRLGNSGGNFSAQVSQLSCSLCDDTLVRNLRVRTGGQRGLRTYVEQALGFYANCRAKAYGECGTGDRRVDAVHGCDGFGEENAYQSCISTVLGP